MKRLALLLLLTGCVHRVPLDSRCTDIASAAVPHTLDPLRDAAFVRYAYEKAYVACLGRDAVAISARNHGKVFDE